MGNRYLVVSDLHLCDVEDHPDGWKAYKGTRFLFDDSFEELVRSFLDQEGHGDRLTLILNGDVIDFDLVTAAPEDPPWPVSRFERKRGLKASAEKSVWKLKHVLSFHPRFIAILGEFVARGHKLVYIMGNHDREFHFPEVQQTFIDAIEKSTTEQGLSLATGTIRFEPWFYYVPDEIYVEHGHQYDFYTSFRYQLWPTVPVQKERVLALPMGNLSNRYLMTRMGYFNPHATDYILNVYRYVLHWLRYYLFSRRFLLFNYLWGSFLVIGMLLRNKNKLQAAPPEHAQHVERIARTFDLSSKEIAALGQLQRRPITSRMFRLIRELWVDRLFIAFLMTGGTIALALVPIPLWIKLMVPLSSFPLLYFLYEQLAKGENVFTIEKEIPKRARAVSKTLPARVITFGHTHTPRLIPLSKETTFVDTGTWAPITDPQHGQLQENLRNYLVVSFHRKEMTLSFGSWMSKGPHKP